MKVSFKHITIICGLLLFAAADWSGAVVRRDVVGYWTLQLQPGFNLVAFPVLPDDPSPASVIGDRLGAVEISTWDRSIGDYRWSSYDPQNDEWSGNLFVLHRGAAYWINLIDAEDDQSLMVTGHPEVYTLFKWSNLGSGWRFYAPVYGKTRMIEDLPPDRGTNFLLAWTSNLNRFELAVAGGNDNWLTTDISEIEPDQGYIVSRTDRKLRRTGSTAEDNILSGGAPVDGGELSMQPPWPLVVGNSGGQQICYADGEVCAGGFTIRTVRESVRLGIDGDFEAYAENMGEQRVIFNDNNTGQFRLALSVSQADQMLNVGDRIYLEILGNEGASTRSTSFEIPADEQVMLDLNFPNPLIAIERDTQTPVEFGLSAPYPNPFNDRFQVEVNIPESAPVKYTIYDLSGRVVRQVQQPMSAGSHRLTIGSNGMATGIYLLEVSTPAGRGIAKIAYIR